RATTRLAGRVAGGRVATGALLLAEGDSWFDYPFADVLGKLQDMFGYSVESVAKAGDRVEDMAYDDGQYEKLLRKFEQLAAQGRTPQAILLSGGGNDIAGGELATLLNHVDSGLPALSEGMLAGIFDERLRAAMVRLIGTVTGLYEAHFGDKPQVFIHGYDYPVPDARGYMGGGGPFPGPWLEPSFRRRGYGDLAINTRLMRQVMDRFNAMAKNVAATPGLEHVTYVDLRGLLSAELAGKAYQLSWANELHPTRPGFEVIAAKFHEVLSG
ncbi:MAG: hypothetical protein HOP12_12460, partial [Candidatus Eisenbacteria bacterium]|nr:hypothetical protein [Candidatus Eisenbacteria bacterium]